MEYEADQRHAETLMRDVGIEEGSKGVATPGVSTREVQVGGGSQYRAVAARRYYFGQDCIDVQFAVKEISRFTSKLEEQD